jgi:hypothetical protein
MISVTKQWVLLDAAPVLRVGLKVAQLASGLPC